MSNYLGIATVTETLRQLLNDAVAGDVPGASATITRPGNGDAGAAPRANVYLYRVSPNGSLRNADLPSRRSDGQLQERPKAALDLHYLLSFFGNEGQLEPQRLLGSAVRTLHTYSVLTRQMITDAMSSTPFGFLAASDLDQQPELVKFTPEQMTLDDLSKLWSVFFQTPYALSVAYEATVVFVEGEESAASALPVQSRNLRVMPIARPYIDRVQVLGDPQAPIVVGSTLALSGQHLLGEVTQLRIGGSLVSPATVTPSEITVKLESPAIPASALKAGIQGVQVVHQVQFDTPSDPHRGSESNMAPFIFRPTVTSVSESGGTITVDVNPPVREGQRATLFLNERLDADHAEISIPLPPFEADAPQLQFPSPASASGEFFVRLQVDGVESPVDLDPASPTIGPTVTLP